MKTFRLPGLTLLVILLTASFAFGGPVILGGDDLTDHGSESGGVNMQGWLYIEKAIRGILAGSTRPGATANTIAALPPPATVTYYDGAPAITTFFMNLGSGATNPAMIWIAGSGAGNDIDAAEGAVLTSNANAISGYVGSGGGLMSHGSGPDVYGWLSVLIPGIVETGDCDASGAMLTAAGMAAFPGLSNSDVDSSAGPCHSSFSGSLGTLLPLVLDGAGRPYIIGGGAGTVIGPSAAVPMLSFPMMAVFGLGLAAIGFLLMRRS